MKRKWVSNETAVSRKQAGQARRERSLRVKVEGERRREKEEREREREREKKRKRLEKQTIFMGKKLQAEAEE